MMLKLPRIEVMFPFTACMNYISFHGGMLVGETQRDPRRMGTMVVVQSGVCTGRENSCPPFPYTKRK